MNRLSFKNNKLKNNMLKNIKAASSMNRAATPRLNTMALALAVALAGINTGMAQTVTNDNRFTPVLGPSSPLYPQSASTTNSDPSVLVAQPGNVNYAGNALANKVVVEVNRNGVPADGQTAVEVSVQVFGDDGKPVTGEVFATIENSGGRLLIPGARTDELGPNRQDADKVTPGVQLLVKNGRASFQLLAPHEPQDVLVRVTVGAQTAEGIVGFVPEMREMLATGLIEGVINFRNKAGTILEPTRGRDVFERDIRRWEKEFNNGKANASARAAFFLKGVVKGEYLLTAAYDSDKDVRGRLLRDIRPEEFYPVYGDSSLRGFDARSAERLYVRLDKNHSYLLYGDFQTGDSLTTQSGIAADGKIPMRSLAAYNRTATGLGWHYENSRLRSNVFAFEDSLRQVIEELPSQGSGPYGLRNNAALEGSERIEVIVRDRNQPSRIVSVRPLQRLVDYSFEPFSGRVLLNTFLPAFDANLNPVSLRITYEVDQGTETFWVYGADAQLRATDHFEIGASYVKDNNDFAQFQMASLNAGFKFGPNTYLVAEYARSESEVNTNPINQYASPGLALYSGLVDGDAWRVEFAHDGERFDARLFAGRSDPTFNNPASPLYGGRGEYNLEATYDITKNVELYGQALRSEDRNPNGGDRSAGSLGARITANKKLTFDFGWRRIEETVGAYSPWSFGTPFGSTGGLSGGFATGAAGGALGFGQQPLDPVTGLPIISSGSGATSPVSSLPIGTELESNTLRFGIGYKATDKLSIGGEIEKDVSGSNRERLSLGLDYQLRERSRVYARYEKQTGLTSAFGITTDDREADALVFGFDSTYLKDTQIFSEYRLRDAINGRDVQTASGIRNFWDVAEGVRISTGLEHINVIDGNTGDATAASFAVDYTASPLWRGSARIEHRRSADIDNTIATNEAFDTTLLQLTAARKLDRDWTLLARDYFLRTNYDARGDVLQNRFQIGVAYRDNDRNRINALARYEYKLESDESGIGIPGNPLPLPGTNQDIQTKAHIVSAHADWHPSRPWWFTGRVAGKWQTDEFASNTGARIEDSFRGFLLSGRAVYDITENWDVGILGATFRGKDGANQYAYGFEVGRLLRQNLWLSVGHNWSGFAGDRDLSGYEYTQQGTFIRLRFKFDEDLFRKDTVQYRDPVNSGESK